MLRTIAILAVACACAVSAPARASAPASGEAWDNAYKDLQDAYQRAAAQFKKK
jgi:hypothetical protein